MMSDMPLFTRFFRSVPGRAVARYMAGSRNALIGAERVNDREIVWYPEAIVPLARDYCRKYVRELDQAVRRGDLIEVTRAEYEASLAPPVPAAKKTKGAPTGAGSEQS